MLSSNTKKTPMYSFLLNRIPSKTALERHLGAFADVIVLCSFSHSVKVL